MHVVDQNPLDTIADLIGHCQPQVDRIVAAVLERSAVRQEVGALRETTDTLAERLAALTADEADCMAMLARLDGDDFDRLPEFDGLDAEEALELRQSLRSRLQAHRGVLQNHQGMLTRGIDIGRAGMINRFATFAVAGLTEDGAHSMPSGLAFIVACQVAAYLKDRLETAGYRWAGEKTLITLYLNAIGCERRKSTERLVADPVASVIATRLGFRSARELHQALHALHEAQMAPAAAGIAMADAAGNDAGGDAAAGAPSAVEATNRPSNAASGEGFHPATAGLGHVQFDRKPCPAFDASYAASTELDEAFLRIMERARSGPSAA